MNHHQGWRGEVQVSSRDGLQLSRVEVSVEMEVTRGGMELLSGRGWTWLSLWIKRLSSDLKALQVTGDFCCL